MKIFFMVITILFFLLTIVETNNEKRKDLLFGFGVSAAIATLIHFITV